MATTEWELLREREEITHTDDTTRRHQVDLLLRSSSLALLHCGWSTATVNNLYALPARLSTAPKRHWTQ